jgi:hypothetical protein
MHRRSFLSLAPAVAARANAPVSPYADAASRLIGAALTDDEGYAKLSFLCDRIGHRLSGSAGLQRAIDWSASELKRDGLSNVQTPPVKVPHWVRGEESALMLEPLEMPLAMLGLGGSVATPAEGISADVVCTASYEELKQLGEAGVRGKIVLYDAPWQGYGRSVQFRSSGASAAARFGAVGALVRSVTPVSLRTPHTGMLSYAADAPKIPAAAVSVEDALQISRLVRGGTPVRVLLKMSAQTLPDADSANVIADLPGREKPDEIVLLGGHLDSWDVGQGAQDDGGGCIACWQAVALMKRLGLAPRRTVRVVLFTNEENGLRGGLAYKEWAGESVSRHVAAIESDGGVEKPLGFGLSIAGASDMAMQRALDRMGDAGRLLNGIGAGEVSRGGGGADISPLTRVGVPGISPRTAGQRYFEWHHTHADTLDKVDPRDFRLNVAALAVTAFVLADMPKRLVEE